MQNGPEMTQNWSVLHVNQKAAQSNIFDILRQVLEHILNFKLKKYFTGKHLANTGKHLASACY